MSEIVYRMARVEDLEQIVLKLEREGTEVPVFDHPTIVAIDPDKEGDVQVVAFVTIRNIPISYWHWDQDMKGYKAAFPLQNMLEMCLRMVRLPVYYIGAELTDNPTMEKVLRRFGFHSTGESLYYKNLVEEIKGVKASPGTDKI